MLTLSPRSAGAAQLSFYVESVLSAARLAVDAEVQAMRRSNAVAVYRPDELEHYRAFWAEARSDGSTNAMAVLQSLARQPAFWPCSSAPSDSAFIELVQRFPNFAAPIEDMRRAAALARLVPGGPLTLSPMLLDGPPGIGKSHFASELASVLAVPLHSFSMSVATASFSLGGLSTQYSGGGPGLLVRSLASLGVPDPVVIVDEIDKAAVNANHDPTGPLYELLELRTAAKFVDEGLMMPLNLSAIRWVCTCNNADLIAEPLRSRLMHYEVPAPTPNQMRDIASGVYRDVVSKCGVERYFDPALPARVLDELAECVPRDLARSLRNALGAAALDGRSTIRIADLPLSRRSGRTRIGFA